MVTRLSQTHTAPQSLAEVAATLGQTVATPGMVGTGFDPLDHALDGGFRTGDLALIGGSPGVGKTAVTLQWARNAAASGRRAVYVCYEHDERTLFGRLLALEVGDLVAAADTATPTSDTRRLIRSVVTGRSSLDDAVAGNLLLRAAYTRLEAYSPDLWLLRASGVDTGLEELREIAGVAGAGSSLFLDYLQKIPLTSLTGEDRVIHQAEGLKELAMDYDVAVVAIVASDQMGLNTRRLRLHQLRGAAGLAYEADLIVMMNEKYFAVSKRHSAYDPVQAEGFKEQVVFSIDKNREGRANLDLEFTKDFGHYRFDPAGGFVEEQLIDELLFPE